ncbi:Metallo-dependent phosphatase [Zopfia rhizophila CBS 207.26]|uniref:Metallo-dependent phosphatase n=1 Tax=Zopfia rhizophila CBS 207.26 TaxID=1314779 RepID=A0A6A6EFV9_9PEZI|nr:Metallo-dependent phosphatase [Zopfia rhizophila CBS 207.26]
MVFETLTAWRPPKPTPQAPNDPFKPASLPSLLYHAPVKLLLHRLYVIFTYLHTRPIPSDPSIRIVCISDTHEHIPENVPAGDILIYAGDMTNDGSVESIQKHVDWLNSLPHQEIVLIAGNHDTYLDPRTRPSLPEAQRKGSVNWKRVHYLQHRSITLTITVEPGPSSSREHLLSGGRRQRRIKLYGAPQIPACGPMSVHAFQYPRGADAWSETVPADTDILITHTPPKFHMDLPLPSGMGCEHLATEVRRVKPTLHVFGHVHWGAGQMVVWWDGCQEAYERGMAIRSRWTHGVLNPWLWWNVVRVGYRGVRGLVWDKIWGGQRQSTIMVNAAQMYGNTGRLGNPVQVVDI